MSPSLSVALGIVRGWTRLYTARLPADAREERRAEIESDLWEFHEDARRRGSSPTGIAILMLLRLVLGIHDDLIWRVENRVLHVDAVQQALWAAAIASVAGLWLVIGALQTREPSISPVGTNTLVRMLYPVHVYPPSLPPPLPAPSLSTPAHVIVHVTLNTGALPPPPPPSPDRWR